MMSDMIFGSYAIGAAITLATVMTQVELGKAVGFGPSLTVYPPVILLAVVWGRRSQTWRKSAYTGAVGNAVILFAGLGLVSGVVS